MLNGAFLGQQQIRLSWATARPPKKQVQPAGWVQTQQLDPNQVHPVGWVQNQQPDPNHWNGGYYGDVQGHNAGYDYAAQPQDLNIYSYTSPNANYSQ